MIKVLLIILLKILSYQTPEKIEYSYVPSVEEYESPVSWEEQGQVMRVTCYTSSLNAHTYSGQIVHEGGCASNKANLGKVAYLYTIDTHELVAICEINDIGGHYQLQNGTALDVWQPSYSMCREWIKMYGDYLFVIIKDAEG